MGKKNSTYILPDGWCKTSIEEILYLEYGKSLPQKNRVESGKYPVYGSNGKIGNHNESLIKGPIIILGRKGSVGAVHYEKGDCWPIDTTYFIKTINSLNDKFIYYLLKTLNLGELDSSTAIPGINRNNVYEKNILLPPFKEQHRIVSKIEEHFSELDHAEEGLKKAKKQLKVYRQALLKSAFDGKLTEKWREEKKIELTENLLKRIKQEREIHFKETLSNWERELRIWELNREKGKKPIQPKKNKDVVVLTPKELQELINLPHSWKWVKVESIADVSMGQSPPGESYNTNGNGIPLINGPVEFGPSPFSKTLLKKWTTSPTKMCKEGDLILCVRGSTTGRQNIAGFDACIGRGVASISAIYVSQRYIAYYFHFSEGKIFNMGTGTTFPSISNEQISSYPIPICALDEQHQIVQELESRITLIENLEKSISIGYRKAEAFRYAILKKAFEGKLVPQNSNDESATQLLKQIQIEKQNYIKVQKEAEKKIIKKPKKMEQKNLTVKEILQKAEKPLSAFNVWKQSKHHKDENIDDFYAELKEIQKEIKVIQDGKESFITLIK